MAEDAEKISVDSDLVKELNLAKAPRGAYIEPESVKLNVDHLRVHLNTTDARKNEASAFMGTSLLYDFCSNPMHRRLI